MSDLDDLCNLYSQAELMQRVDGAVRSCAVTKEYLTGYISDYERYGFGLYAAILKATGEMVGRCGLIPVLKETGVEGELVFLFKKEYWGQGLATEFSHAIIRHAFEKLHLSRVFATADADHIAAIKVLRKAGMHLVRSTPTQVEYEIRNQ
jgi:RimJ/RimL family protein N-acetyltransferase